jgi:hypothetical protein
VARVTYNDGPYEATWLVTENDGLSRRFRIKDDAGDYVTDPEGAGWEFFGQVREERGGTIVDDITFTIAGEWITQQLPTDIADGTFWWEKEVTPPDGPKRTIESGPLVVLLDSAVDGGS